MQAVDAYKSHRDGLKAKGIEFDITQDSPEEIRVKVIKQGKVVMSAYQSATGKTK